MIGKCPMSSKRFCVIAPTYNAEKTARQAILSLAAQSYQNWKLIVIDDVSTDDTRRTILELSHALGFYRYGSDDTNRVQVVFNKEKKWEIENTLLGLSMCSDDDIIVRMDLDDYCLNNATFEILNNLYEQDPNLEAIWTSHLWFSEKTGITNTNISGPLPDNADPYTHPWVSSHMKTWRKYVSNNVHDENYRGKNGKYFTRIGDQAFYLPVLKLAKKRGFLPLTTYAYRCEQTPETFQTDDAKFQAEEAVFLRSRGFIAK